MRKAITISIFVCNNQGEKMIIRISELPISGDWDHCIQQAINTARLTPRPDVIVLPELFTIGFDLEKIAGKAIKLNDLKDHAFARAALELGITIVGGTFPISTSRGIVNTLPVWNSKGEIIHTTEKVHLFRNMNEDSVFTEGIPSGVFDLNGVLAGASICYDLRFPELFRRLVLKGAKIIFLPAQWPEQRIELFRSFIRARAGEAQVFFAGCNLGGDYLGEKFRGGGGISSPDGVMMDGVEVNEFSKDYHIDFDLIDSVRNRISCLEDRRPSVYGDAK